MGMLDKNLQFSKNQVITNTAASTNFLDLATGLMGTTTFTPAPSIIFGANETYFGEDLGLGKGVGTPVFIGSVGAAFTVGASMNIQIRGAPDNLTAHASGNRSDLTFVVYIETAPILEAVLTAGARIFQIDWPKRLVAAALPRFIDLNYVVSGAHSTGDLTVDISLVGGEAQDTLPQYGSGFTVGA